MTVTNHDKRLLKHYVVDSASRTVVAAFLGEGIAHFWALEYQGKTEFDLEVVSEP